MQGGALGDWVVESSRGCEGAEVSGRGQYMRKDPQRASSQMRTGRVAVHRLEAANPMSEGRNAQAGANKRDVDVGLERATGSLECVAFSWCRLTADGGRLPQLPVLRRVAVV